MMICEIHTVGNFNSFNYMLNITLKARMLFMQPRFSKAMLLFVPYNISHLEMKNKFSFPYEVPVCPFPLLDSSLCHSHHKSYPEVVVNYKISC